MLKHQSTDRDNTPESLATSESTLRVQHHQCQVLYCLHVDAMGLVCNGPCR